MQWKGLKTIYGELRNVKIVLTQGRDLMSIRCGQMVKKIWRLDFLNKQKLTFKPNF